MEQAPAPVPAAPPPAPSFSEVLRLVQSGQEPPGVRRPRASPTGDTPTASRLPPPAKPWAGRPLEHGSAHR
uniref:Peroxisomal membrane protein PEX14-like KPWE domain-containing protein n=1 Tax=Melopsittacus undulatus TaxID=13146 RepID=A0A8V5G079_MELUD